jgi:hypothetical protein
MIFRTLTAVDEARFRAWSRSNYRPGDPISGTWHPITQAEAVAMNNERAVFVADAGDEEEEVES